MRILAALLFGLMIPFCVLSVSAPAADATKDATDAATTWLALVDAGQYEQGWTEASDLFRGRVTAAQWTSAMKSVRAPLGALQSRRNAEVKFTSAMPGAPDGRYAVVQFHSRFEHKADAIETVVLVLQGSAWKTAGYFIK